MVRDTVMAVPAVPVERDGTTYFGCCEMCKGKIAAYPERWYTKARDPVSGAVVDNATAALLYFGSEGTRESYTARLAGPP